MSEPLVCAIMLTRDRPEMARRAVECFRAQTYRNARLCVLNSSRDAMQHLSDFRVGYIAASHLQGKTIGELRNFVPATLADHYPPDIYVHWDDDDWSHPNRIAEQVALLQSSGADVVGYNEMLFWNSRPGQLCGAWLYSNPAPRYALGTSLCYWRRTWERTPFPATSQGEDVHFLARAGKIAAASSFSDHARMIASIHGGNSSNAYDPAKMRIASEWRRTPEWDEALRERMTKP